MPPRRTTNRQPTNQVIDVQSVAAGRIPPHNRDAEVAVLGACLIDSQAMGRIVDRIRSEDFYDLPFQTIYAAMRSLYDGHRPIDLVTLADELTKNNQLDSVGGHAAIASLAASVATAGNIVTYAEIVRHRAMLRRLMNAASTIGELAFREEIESEKLVDEAEQALYAVTGRFIPQQFVAVKSVLDESFERINQLHSGGGTETRGVPSGFSSLDGLLGGFQKSDLVILAARPSMGKTAFALNIAEHAAVREKKTVGIFSMEMAKEQLVDRLVSSLGRIDSWKLRNGYLDDRDFASLNEAYGSLAEANLFIDDSAGSSVTEVRAKARRLQSEHGLDMLIVDYLQLMREVWSMARTVPKKFRKSPARLKRLPRSCRSRLSPFRSYPVR